MKADTIAKAGLIGFSLCVLALVGWFAVTQTTKQPSKPKEAPASHQAKDVPDQGNEHVEDISEIIYQSNPPTSGAHFAVWAKPGVYDRVISDGHLIHSLEHGYVIISYNCGPLATESGEFIYETGAPLTKEGIKPSGMMSAFMPENAPKEEVKLSQEFSSEACKALVDQLAMFVDEQERVIVVPRPNMGSKIALTAWTKIDTMNDFQEDRIRAFVEAFHNQGPERTIE